MKVVRGVSVLVTNAFLQAKSANSFNSPYISVLSGCFSREKCRPVEGIDTSEWDRGCCSGCFECCCLDSPLLLLVY